MTARIVLALVPLVAAGCLHSPDVEIKNPIVSRAVDANRIVKDHGYAEQAHGLPAGSLADEAFLTAADPGKLCFAVTMRELAPIDLHEVAVALSAPGKDAVEQAQAWSEPATMQTYEGLVPERRETGVETVCSSHDSNGVCVAWQTHPVYATVYVRGPVNVYQARGKLCFANTLLTSVTEQIALELRLARQAGEVATVGMWGGFGGGTKKTVFRWGFVGGVKK